MDLTSPNFISSADGEQSRSTKEGKPAHPHPPAARAEHAASRQAFWLESPSHRRAGIAQPGGHGKAAPKAPGKGPPVFQAQLKFTFKLGSLGAATLSLLILLSSETKAKDALPSGIFVFSQSEPQLSCGEQTLLGTSQPPCEYASRDTARKTAEEGTDTTSIISAEL